jgi:hypothetical protein
VWQVIETFLLFPNRHCLRTYIIHLLYLSEDMPHMPPAKKE